MISRLSFLVFVLFLTVGANGAEKPPISIVRKETLNLVGFQWGEPHTFNPLNGWPSWPVRYEFNLMYEPLLNYNSLTGEIEPLLGSLHQTNNDIIEVLLNPKAKWSDGKPVTAADVIFSYTLSITNSESPCSFIEEYIEKVTVRKEGTKDILQFHVNKKEQNNPPAVLSVLTWCSIYPKHIFEPKLQSAGGSIYGMQDDLMMRPQVVSGPYNYYDHSKWVIVIERRDDYWGNEVFYQGRKAAPRYIAHPIYKSNQIALDAMLNGAIDMSSNYIPAIWTHWSKSIRCWFDAAPYHKMGSIVMLIVNCQSMDKPLRDARFRRAIAMAIDYDKINRKAISGYSDPLQSGLILPKGPESQFFDSSEVKKYGSTTYDPAKAKALLKEIGYEPTFKGGALVGATWNGESQFPITLTSVAGWSDFTAVINEVVADLNAAGIYAKAKLVKYPQYEEAKYTGKFDLFLETPAAILDASMPSTRFEKVMSSANWKPIGEKMYENTGRFNKPGSATYISAVDSLLELAKLVVVPEERKEIYRKLNRIYMEQQLTIPLSYRPEQFYQFSEKYWKGFPTESLSYAPPHLPVSGSARKMLWHLTPVPQKKSNWKFWK